MAKVTIKRKNNTITITDAHGNESLFNPHALTRVNPNTGNSVLIHCGDGNGYYSVTIPSAKARNQFVRRLARVVDHEQRYAYIKW